MTRIELSPSDNLRSIAFSPDSRTLVTASHKVGLDFWDVRGQRHLSHVEGLAVTEPAWRFGKVVYLAADQGLALATQDHGVVFTDGRGTGLPALRSPEEPVNHSHWPQAPEAKRSPWSGPMAAESRSTMRQMEHSSSGSMGSMARPSPSAPTNVGSLARSPPTSYFTRSARENPRSCSRQATATNSVLSPSVPTEPCWPVPATTTPPCCGTCRDGSSSTRYVVTGSVPSTWRSARTASGLPQPAATIPPGFGRPGRVRPSSPSPVPATWVRLRGPPTAIIWR